MTFGEKLRKARKDKGLTQKELAQIIGAKHNSISNWESDQNKPDPNTIELLCGVLGITPNYLLMSNDTKVTYGDALSPAIQRIGRAYEVAPLPIQRIVDTTLEPYMDKECQIKIAPPKAEDAEISEEISPNLTELKLYTQSVAAGLGNYLDDDNYELKRFANVPYRADIAVRVSGDSMEPDYHDGDIVFVETDSVLRDGEVGVFYYNGDGYIKVLGLNPVRLESYNSKYKDIVVNQDGDTVFQTIGRIVGVVD